VTLIYIMFTRYEHTQSMSIFVVSLRQVSGDSE